MAKRKKKPVVAVQEANGSLIPKILAALLGVGAVGGTGISYATGSHADERSAKLEVRADTAEKSIEKIDKKVDKVDKRTYRMQADQRAIMEALKVKRTYGPDEE